MTWRVITADCVRAMRWMAPNSVDAVVCDPPYGLEFMGKEWDSFRGANSGVKKSGFEKLSKNGTPAFSPNRRNQKCPQCGKWAYDHAGRKCECNGWRQPAQVGYSRAFQAWCEAWATEALRVLKPGGHLLAFGGTRTYHRLASGIEDAGFEVRDCLAWLYGSGFPKSSNPKLGMRSLPRSTMRTEWYVWWNAVRTTATGTALKPAHEPIIVARKPLAGTVAANVLEHGTGALNIDGTRIAGSKGDGNWSGKGSADPGFKSGWRSVETDENPQGRWPANVLLDAEAAAMLDAQTGTLTSNPGTIRAARERGDGWGMDNEPGRVTSLGDSGGASRFFYCAKASRRERNAGLDAAANTHPTVKPIELMRWLCRLVTPPGGLVLDPFTGSGTTGVAAVLEGFRFVGLEQDSDYADIARARIAHRVPAKPGELLVAELTDEQLAFEW